MKLSDLVNLIAAACQELTKGEYPSSLRLRRSARLPVLAALHSQLRQPILLLTDRSDQALILADELSLWIPEAVKAIFPEPTPLFYEDAPWGLVTRRDRLSVLTTLVRYLLPGALQPETHPVIIAPIRAVMTRTLPRRDLLKATRTLKLGQAVQPEELLRHWSMLGYEVANIVIAPGQIARRGGILDIWPPAEKEPTRLEFFGDEIETLRVFDPATQRTTQPVESLQITPAREFIAHPNLQKQAWQISGGKPQDTPSFSEYHIPLFHPDPASLLDYMPPQSLIILEDEEMIRNAAEEIEEQSQGLRKDSLREGTLAEEFPLPYLSWSEIKDSLGVHACLSLGSASVEDQDSSAAISPLAQCFEAEQRFAGRMKMIMDYLSAIIARQEAAILVSRQTTRLAELWAEQRASSEAPAAKPVFIEGSLAEGWIFKSPQGGIFHLFTDGEIFGWRRPEPRQRPRPTAEAPEAAYADLGVGDWVVHIDHGIGRFTDLVRRTVDGMEREYLCIEYAEGDQLFVPVYQADRLTRYVGADNRIPSPSRLGGVEWRNTKVEVKEAVQEVAEDLLALYAQRCIVQGYAFGQDTPWQRELEASFPYVETEDQLHVIAEVKRDMENPRPMDRLICGDVGYGKTEVALRASFKAVMEGKQVAILVPTTVLAQQHYHTFSERLAAFPVEVEMLSRFRTQQQQRDILERLAKGSIDIVIGTHRLIQDDVSFKDLGLLIIDEEQRFGVFHKEMLKRMRTEVDVLTLTATPIPRTLYMALTGVRDISTINTPPEERLPIITHVGPYSPKLARQAILREMERGGQVFYVHNRVQTIGAMRTHLEKLVPEARVAVAHGQMAETELSHRMDEFTEGKVDVLLSTSIIESGLDIPNANTLIVDRADTFGLAQLYQLRGRVGRGAQRAYAYFFRHSRKQPTLEGRERLETIAENTQLGAGYSIAMRDLEIRGMGDILGTRQHGHVAAVGFHLYTRLLAEAVRLMRLERQGALPEQDKSEKIFSLSQEIRTPVTVELPLDIGIPIEYVSDRDMRLRLYRRIADITNLVEAEALHAEFVDRFGPLPNVVSNLIYQLKIRLLAEKVGLITVSAENGQIMLRYPPLPEGVSTRSIPDYNEPDVRVGKNALWLINPGTEDWQKRLVTILERLAV